MGGDKVAEVLGQLKALQGSLAGGSVFGSGQSSPTGKAANELNKAAQAGGALNQQLKAVGETLSKIRKVDDLTGGIHGITPKMLAMMSESDREKVMAKQREMAGGLKAKQVTSGWGVANLNAIRDLNKFWDNASKLGASASASANKWFLAAVRRGSINSMDWWQKAVGIGSINSMDWWQKAVGIGSKGIAMGQMQGPDLNGALRMKQAEAFERLMARHVKSMGAFDGGLGEGTNWKKAALGVGAGLFNPWIGSRILSDVFKGSGGGAGGGAAKGIFGAGGAMGFTEFYLAFKALQVAMGALKKVVDEVSKSFENARQLYAKALTSGLGLGFTTRRSLIANTLGVSEADIFKFGNQLAYLNPRLKQASEILARTAAPLTKVSYDWKVLMVDISASFARLASDVAPALDKFINRLDSFVKIINDFNPKILDWAQLVTNPGMSAIKGLFHPLSSQPGNLPGPTSWMKQLPASSWEHMGLQIAGGGNNYARDTARNTSRMAKNLEVIAKHFTMTQKPYGNMPWGMNPFANNP
jgi:hypothetical protein